MDENSITIAVCGDSFCSASTIELKPVGIRSHFSQILEDQYGYKILHYAHGGFGNRAILFQIEAAVKKKPDVIVYTTTWNGRIDLVVREKFNLDSGMHNFVYYDPHAESTAQEYTGDHSGSILSTVWHGIEHNTNFTVSKEQKTAIDLYLKYMFCDTMEEEIKKWLFDYWHQRIEQSGILPIRFKDDDIGKVAYDFSEANWLFDSPFHTDRATQEVIAANIHRRIVDSLKQRS